MAATGDSLEDEFDPRPYLRAIMRTWRWILLGTVVGAAIGAIMLIARPPSFAATASVLIRSTRLQPMLEPRFLTQEAITDASTHRKALVSLAQSEAIEMHIPADVLEDLAADNGAGGNLASQISVSNVGDALLITARSTSAEQARELANAWATGFVTYANKMYGGSREVAISNELVAEVEQRYTAAQQDYEQFVGSNHIDELDHRIAAVTSVLTGSLEAGSDRYGDYLSRIQTLDALLGDAEALREQIAAGRSLGLADALASLVLRGRSISGSEVESLPIMLQLTPEGMLAQDRNATLADLDTLIGALRKQISDVRVATRDLAGALAQDVAGSESDVILEQREAYMAELSRLRQQREKEAGQLRKLVQERDLALDAVKVVRTKLVEEQIAATQSNAEVRLDTLAEQGFAVAPRTLSTIGIGGAAGALLGTVVGLLMERAGIAFRIPRRRRSIKRPVNYPSSG